MKRTIHAKENAKRAKKKKVVSFFKTKKEKKIMRMYTAWEKKNTPSRHESHRIVGMFTVLDESNARKL